MRYERLRAQSIIHYSQSHEQRGEYIFIKRGMLLWMKSLAHHENRKMYPEQRGAFEQNKPLEVNSNIVMLVANMVINNHVQGEHHV
jgi:hypothetical protein